MTYRTRLVIEASARKGRQATKTRGMDMKTGSCAMTGFTLSTLQRFSMYCVVLALFGRYQAARRYLRCSRWAFRFNPATICLALAFIFSGAVGALAQSITITADAGPDRTVASGATVTLDGSGSTASDGTTLYYIWIISDDSAEHVPGFSLRSGKVQTFTAPDLEPGAADVTISFILQVRDRPGFIGDVSSGDTVTITVEAPNAPPVADAGPDHTIKPGRTVTLDGTGSTDDDHIASYSWNRTGGTCTVTTVFGGVSSLTGTNALPSFTAETLASGVASCTHDFKLFVTDNDGVLGGTGDSVTVTIIATAENQRPIARVGANQTAASGTGFLLDGVGSTDDGAIGEYEWWRLDPSTGDIGLLVRNPGSITGVFVTEDILPGDADIVFTYYLNVKDNEGTSCEKQIAGGNNGELFCDSVAVTVTAPFATPVARAVTAESEYASGARVTLDGSGSSVDRRRGPISHAWERTDGTTGGSVTLSDKNVAKPTFTADTLAAGAEDVIHIFTLTVTDKEGATDTDTVTVTVKAPDVPNAGPIANPGSNQTVASGATVTLDGSGSTTSPGRTITWYAWGVNDSSVSGCDDPPPSLSNAPLDGKARLSFTAEVLESGAADVTYCIDLSVRDSAGGRSPFVRVKVTVEAPTAPANKAPVADAGPDQTIKPGRTVTLDGTGSTDDDRIASYSWNRTGGTCTVTTVFGGVSSLTGTNALPSFTAETLASGVASCTHDFILFVTDNDGVLDGTGDRVTVTIIATAANQSPIARAGPDQTVESGAMVTLDGSLSSDDGTIAAYLWNVTSPDQVKIPPTDFRDGTTATPSFTAETLESGTEDVIYHFSLRVQDNEGLWSNIDHMTVAVTAPVADTTAPTAMFETVPATHDGKTPFDMAIVFSEPVDGFTAADVVRTPLGLPENVSPSDVPSPTITNFMLDSTNGMRYTFTLTPRAPYNYYFAIAGQSLTDKAGNENREIRGPFIDYANVDPVANAGTDQTVASEAPVTLDGSGSTDNGMIASHAWARTGGTTGGSVTLSDKNVAKPTFTADTLAAGAEDVIHIFTLTVTDNEDATDTDTVTITVEAPTAPANKAPVADAGPDHMIKPGRTVTLDGTGSTDDDRIASYSWNRTGGTCTVTTVFGGVSSLTGTNALPSFTAETLASGVASCTHDFILFVTDNDGVLDGTGDRVTVTIIATAANQSPIARAGPDQTVESGAMVTLDGSLSSDDGTIASYTWVQASGETVPTLSDNNAAKPTLTAPTLNVGDPAVKFSYALRVEDNEGSVSSADTVEITVTAPVADTTAPTAVFEGPTTHDGKTPLDMAFVFSEPVVGFTADDVVRTPYDLPLSASVNSYRPTISNFKKDSTNALRYTFTLTPKAPNAPYSPYDFDVRIPKHRLTDGAGNQNERILGPIVNYANVDPVANAGTNQTVASEAPVTLDGSGSTDNGMIASHAWARTGGTTGGSVTLSDTKVAKPTFTADTLAAGAEDVIHIFTLTVTDNEDATDTDTVTITVEAPTAPANKAPVADAGPDQTIKPGRTVTLDGTGSTDDDRIASYSWNRTGGTCTVTTVFGGVSSLTGTNALPSFTAETLASGVASCTHDFILFVTDNDGVLDGTGDRVTVTIIATAANQSPIARAGPDQTVESGAMVTLDGSLSSDDGTIASYTWVQASGETVPTLSDNNAAKPTLTAPTLNVGDPAVKFSYALRVEDNESSVSSADTVEITVTAPVADTTAPTGRIEPIAATHDGMTAITMTVDFDEPVTGFVASDITVTIALPVGFPDETYGPTITNFAVDPNDATQYTFTLTPRAPIDINLTVQAGTYADEAGNMGPRLFRIVGFTGSNWPPIVAAGDNRSVVGGTLVTLEGSAKDIDGTVASYAWARTGGTTGATATLSNTTVAMPTFTANTLEAGAVDETHEFTLTVTDDDAASSTGTVTITVTAPFVTTVANAGDNQTVTSGAMVELVGSGSSVDRRRTATYNWARTGGTTGGMVTLNPSETAQNPTFTADTLAEGATDVTHTFTLTVTDDLNVVSTDTVTVTVLAPVPVDTTPPEAVFRNLPATHDGMTAFNVQVKFTEPVIGFGLDKIFGSLAENRSDAKGVSRTNFTQDPNDPTLYTITLTPRDEISFRVVILAGVTDASGNALAQVAPNLIRYEAPRRAPDADAGDDQIVFSGATVMLDARGTSDFDDLVVKWLWEWTDDGTSTVEPTITNATAEQASFVAETLTAGASDVTHIIKLTVTDQAGNEDTDTVTITVREPFATPVANAGPDQLEVVPGATVTLDGSGSSVDRRRTATYSWERTDGTSGGMVTLSPSATVQNPTFTADTLAEGDSDVTHILTLTVTDGEGGSATDATDTVTITVKAPVADTTGPTGTITALALARNTHDGMTPINFEVVFNEPVVGFTAEDIGRDPWNVPDDEDAATHTATISKFMKDSTNPLRYTFTLTPGVDSSGSGSELAFTVFIAQNSLTDAAPARNQNLNIRGPHLTYSATPSANTPPVADAGLDQTVDPGVLVTLDGSGSMDAEGTVTYLWERTGGTDGATATLSDPMAAKPTFTADNVAPGTVNVVHIFTLTVTDEAGVSREATVRVTVPSAFLTLAAEAGDPQTVVSGALVTLDGSASIVDGRVGIGRYSWARTGGTTGATATLSDDNAIMPTFTADTLAEGAPDVTHIFTLTVIDNADNTSNDRVTITVTAPVTADTTVPMGVFEGVPETAGVPTNHDGMTPINLAIKFDEPVTDPEVSGFSFLANSGFLTLPITNLRQDPNDETRYFFTLTPSTTEGFQLRLNAGAVTDKAGNRNPLIRHSINYRAPAFADPVAIITGAAEREVASGGTVMLDGSGSTFDSRRSPLTYLWARTDGTSTVNGTLTGATTATPSFTAEILTAGAEDVTHILTLTVTDSANETAMATVTITVTSGFADPVAIITGAAEREVASGGTVMLDGSGSTFDSRRSPLTYLWARTDGTSTVNGTLTGATTATPSFTAEILTAGAEDVTHILTLTVTDSANETAMATVTVTVTSPFAPTVANAGPDKTVTSGGTVTLDGGGSTSDRRFPIGEYAWTRTGTGGSLTDADEEVARFTAPALTSGAPDETHIFTLTVTDSDGDKDTDTVTITVLAPLVAQAGPAQPAVASGMQGVQLDGTGSTATVGVRTVTYAWTWTQTGGDAATVTLSDENILRPTFDAPTLTAGADDATYIFTLTVTDNQGSTAATDTVTVTVTSPFAETVANAGPDKTVTSGGTVTLDGSGSTSDRRFPIGEYAWTRTGTGGSLTDADEEVARFTAPALTSGAPDETHIFTLTVTDSDGDTDTDTVTITVTTGLVAEAGTGGTVDHEAVVPLVGTGSTVSDSNRTITYAWSRTGGTGDSSVAPDNPAALLTNFTAETLNPGATAVTHIFTLTVTDNQGSAAVTDTVTFTVNAPDFDALVAEAGTGGMVSHEATVPLVGTGSTVSDSNRTITYAWARTGGTGDSSVAPDNPAALLTSFTAETLNPGATAVTHIFTLTVTDDQSSAAATDTVTFTVNAPDFDALVAEAGTGGMVSHEATVPLVGTGSTVSDSNRTITYAWARTGGTGDSSVAPDNPAALLTSFTAETLNPGATAVTHIFTLTVTDDQSSAAATDTVTFTVNAPDFDALVAEAGTGGMVSHEATVPLVGTGSTVSDSNRTITYAWARTGGTGDSSVAPDNPAALLTSFTAETLNPGATAVTHIFTLTVTDDQSSAAATDTVTFTVNAPDFDALVAEAGTGGMVSHEAMVPLVGTGSTVSDSNRTITYAWARTGGTGDSSVAPDNPAALLTSFTAETLNPGATAVTHIFTLTVTDDQSSAAATDTVTFTVNAPDFDALVAEAGTGGMVSHEAVVPLVGTGSTVSDSNRTITYAWSRTGGTGDSSVAPDNPAALLTSFTAETLNPGATAVTHIFTLTVTDDQSSAAATDTVTFTVNAPDFDALVAEAGTGGTVSHEAVVPLVGTGSTVSDSNRTITYAWARTGGTGDSSVAPDNPAALLTSFTAETLNPGATAVTHIFTLTVTDNQGSAAVTDTVTFTVNAPDFDALVAVAGTGGTVSHEAVVPLVGTGSTVSDSNRTITYAWARTGGTGDSSVAPLAPAALVTSFTTETLNPGDAPVTHIFTLRVTDNQGSAAVTETVTFTVTAPEFAALVAEAGTGGSVDHEAAVPLDGTGSTLTGGGRDVTYLWTRTGGTGDSSVAPSNPAALQTSFTAETLAVGAPDVTHIFTLRVTDNQGSTAVTDTVTFTVTASAFGNLVAEAGTGGSVDHEAAVPLDGTGSTVSDSNRTVTYLWTRTGGNGDNSVVPRNPALLQTSFTAETLNPGATAVTYIFTLRVTDNQGSTAATDTVTFTVTAPMFPALTANAGSDKSVVSEGTVTLDGSGTATGSGRNVAYLWTRTSGTGGTLTGETTLTPSFAAPALTPGDADVTHVFTLTVTDDQTTPPATDTVEITVTATPVVSIESPNAAPNGTIQAAPGETVTLRSVTEADVESYSWERTGGTGDRSDVTLSGLNTATLSVTVNTADTADTAQTSFVADTRTSDTGDRTTHIFTLTVTDSADVTHTAMVTVVVSAVAQVEVGVDPILRPVGEFLAARATALLNTQPDLTRFIKQDGTTQGGGGSFTFQATDGRLALDGGFIHNSVWGEVTGSRVNSESGDTRSVLGSFGIHRKYYRNFLAGALLQLDLAENELAALNGRTGMIDGTGWLVGPYFAARHDTQPLYFEGRLLYGQSDNDIRFIGPALGVRTGSFDTRRLLAQLRVEGEIALSAEDSGPRLIPYADALWTEDRAKAFTDNGGIRVPGQKVSIGQLELGSNVEVPVAVRTGAMALTGGLGLVWSNTDGDYITSDSRSRGRGEIGFSYDLDDNVQIDFESFYDGIGASGYESYGLSLRAEMKF